VRKPLFYAGSGLDRFAHRRRDAAWIESLLRADGGEVAGEVRLLPLWRSLHAVVAGPEPRPLVLPIGEAHALLESAAQVVFLGQRREVASFAIDLSPLEESDVRARLAGDLADLRLFGSLLAGEDAALLAYARAILHWHRQHRFCGACGSPTESEAAGHVRRCSDPACAIEHFPRTDPAVIMLVRAGDCCLLARQSRWPPGMVSTLAGFVEPGESLEEAVAREVGEEVGVAVDEVVYRGSQPWPFPCSIMLGFHAVAASTEIRIDPGELEHAAWFTRAEVRAFGEADFRNFVPPPPGSYLLPPRDSIARWLIEGWLAGE
jgi:NAD+ diphosphatase